MNTRLSIYNGTGIVLECRRGHRSKPLLPEWFQLHASPALEAGYETVTVARRHMDQV
jgi:hypothetical protein